MQLRADRRASVRVAYIAVFTALSAVIGYVELLIPINIFGIPGVKLGLANIASVIAMYLFGPAYAFLIMTTRVILLGLMFGNMYSVLFSFAGGSLSIIAMMIFKKSGAFSVYGVSTVGGTVHNLGQLLVASVTLNGIKLYYYAPVLIIAGEVCGFVIGALSAVILNRLFFELIDKEGKGNDRVFKGDTKRDL
ncbi:MAG: Gx transporter family protein [Lachnospiraceae bacterium]|nr:Gx transporter family protein [Lachnospiraceae bacterium]